ncbi:MAG: S-layer homology domain-containing protein [Anaerolineales bacterium]|nr:S-layer homology domain-containing protein [Anaerolineales bacterium]
MSTQLNDVDDGTCNGTHCSLREAIIAASNAPSNDTITFSVSGTIRLGSTLPTIYNDGTLTIDGGNAITLSGDTDNSGTGDVQLLSVSGVGNLTLQNITLTKGMNSVSGGGAIESYGILTIDNCIISDSTATAVSNGGGGVSSASAAAVLTITNSTFSNNTATYFGGAILNSGSSTATISDTTFNGNESTSNSGGAINNSVATLIISDSIFSGNTAFDSSGAINSQGGGVFTISGSTFTNNQADFAGAITINNASAEISNSAFLNNTASNDAGAIYFSGSGSLVVSNSTFSGNSTTSRGGAIFSFGSVSLTNATLSGNIAPDGNSGGIHIYNNTLTLKNTIIANNNGGDCILSGTSSIGAGSSHNLLKSTGAEACGLTNGASNNVIGSDPNLGTLTGSPAYLPLNSGSPAIDTASDATCIAAPVSNTSQNGVTRPQDGDGNNTAVCDIGAYEAPDTTAPTVTSSARASTNPTSSTSVNFTVTFSEPVTGVDLTDFSLTTSGVSTAAVSGISGSGSVYAVGVNTGVGSGTIRLDVLDNDSILDSGLNPLSAGFTVGESYTVSKTAIFTDVPYSYWANSYIERLYTAGITGGCGTGIYCPDNSVTRAQMAIFLLKGIHGSSYAPPAVGASTGFGDVATDYWAAAWIKQLAAEGITGGCGGGNYCPDNVVTRAQMAVFLLKAKNGSSYSPPAVGVSTGFNDVATDAFAAAFIKQLVAEGITAGCGNSNYCPDDSVTRAQMAVFLVRAFNLP